jgi:hypothetical protein
VTFCLDYNLTRHYILLKKLFKYLRINRNFEFPGPIDELTERMNFLTTNQKRFRCEKRSLHEFKIKAKFSLGTLIVAGGWGSPINILMQIKEKEESNPHVEIRSKIRIEHYFFLAIFGFLFLITLSSDDQPWSINLFMVGLFVAVHFWFHMIYRVHENKLIHKLKGQLKLVEKKIKSST